MRTFVVNLMGIVMAAALTATAAVDSARDEQAVRKVVADFNDAWNKHDPNAILALFTDDADWVNVQGMWWRGRTEHLRGTAWVHDHVFKNAHGHTESVAVRFPTQDTAVAIFSHTVDSFVLPDGTRDSGDSTGCRFFW